MTGIWTHDLQILAVLFMTLRHLLKPLDHQGLHILKQTWTSLDFWSSVLDESNNFHVNTCSIIRGLNNIFHVICSIYKITPQKNMLNTPGDVLYPQQSTGV